MKRLNIFLLLTLVLASCGTKSNRFKIDGKFLNLNQGEFYVYSMDGSINGLDTIKVEGGRFRYDIDCTNPSTLVIVFPNYSEQPVFAEPGGKVKIKADASHLKQMEITGTDENELMTKFRKMIDGSSPPDVCLHAETFIKDHSDSKVAIYLLQKYFLNTHKPDYSKALELSNVILAETHDSLTVMTLQDRIEVLSHLSVGKALPKFSAKDINGKKVSNSIFKGKPGLLSVWGLWNYDSENAQSRMLDYRRLYGDKLAMLSICIDADANNCKKYVKRDSITWTNVCDELLFESPVLRSLGVTDVPFNILIDKKGKVVAVNPDINLLEEELKKLIK